MRSISSIMWSVGFCEQLVEVDERQRESEDAPLSERALHRWNGNPWSPDGGSNGREMDDGAAFLLGYWAGVYYGYLPSEIKP